MAPIKKHAFPLTVSGTALTAFLIYWLTLAPDLTWANFGVDGGELITAAVTLGVPHPPGYPTYVLLGKLISFIPLGPVAYRFNLLSAVATAIAAAFVAATTWQQITQHRWSTALSSGLAFALAPLVWSQALITEVYGLNLACVAVFVWALLGQRPSWLVGLFLGLSTTTHLTSLLLIPLALWLTPRPNWFQLLPGWLLGLTPFLLIPILANTGSPVIWGQPHTLSGWWQLISGRLYRDNVLALPADQLGPRLWQWGQMLVTQFTWMGLPLIAVSFGKREYRQKIQWGLLATAALYALYALGYHTNDATIFFLPGLLLLSILLANGLQSLGLIALLLPLASLLLNFNEQDLSHDRTARVQVTQLLQTAPVNAILVTPGDGAIFTLWYFQHVEDQRPDVILVDSSLFAFDWYRAKLPKQYPDVEGIASHDLAQWQKDNQQRPFCQVSLFNPNPLLTCHEGTP